MAIEVLCIPLPAQEYCTEGNVMAQKLAYPLLYLDMQVTCWLSVWIAWQHTQFLGLRVAYCADLLGTDLA